MTTATPRWRRQLVLTFLAAFAGLAAPVVAETPEAGAHSDLTATSPDAGSRTVPPKSITLTFSDEVEPTFARITLAADGAEPVTLLSEVTGSEVRASPPTERPRSGPDQEWKIAYRVVSGDGHPITGTLTFTVISVPANQETASTSPSGTPSPSAATASPTPGSTATPATPTSTVPPGFPSESDVHRNSSRTWPFIIIMSGLLLLAPAMAGLFRLLPNDPGGVTATRDAPLAEDTTSAADEQLAGGSGATPGEDDGEADPTIPQRQT